MPKKREFFQSEPQHFEEGLIRVEDNVNNDAVLSKHFGPLQKRTENENGRVYTDEFWQEQFNSESFQERLEKKLLLGRISHPEDSADFDLNRAALTTSSLKDGKQDSELNDDLIYGTVEVLNTEAGQNLNAMMEAGVQFGFSSRALVYSESREGIEYITGGEMYGWDAVLEPSVEEAYPEKVENIEESGEEIPYKESPDTVVQELTGSKNSEAQVICEAIDANDSEVKQEENNDDNDQTEESSMEDVELSDVLEDKEFDEVLDACPEFKEQIDETLDELNQVKEEKQEIKEERDELEEELETVKERAIERFEDMKEEYENLKQNAKTKFEDVKEEYQDMKERAEYWLERLRDRYNEDFETLWTDLEDTQDYAKELVNEVQDEYEDKIDGLEQEIEEKQDQLESSEDASEQAVEFYAKYQAEKLSLVEGSEDYSLLINAESIDQVDRFVDEIEKAERAQEEGLPYNVNDSESEQVAEAKDIPNDGLTKRTQEIIDHSK
jgi:hypothetical protein